MLFEHGLHDVTRESVAALTDLLDDASDAKMSRASMRLL